MMRSHDVYIIKFWDGSEYIGATSQGMATRIMKHRSDGPLKDRLASGELWNAELYKTYPNRRTAFDVERSLIQRRKRAGAKLINTQSA